MFRSWGELASCAGEVFELFAEPATAPAEAAAPTHSSSTTSSPPAIQLGLSRVGLECAFFVLFGRYPSASLVTDCFAASPPPSEQHSAAHELSSSTSEARARATAAGRWRRVDRDAFLRFIALCAEEEGDGFVVNAARPDYVPVAAVGSTRDTAKAAQLHSWRQFECVAGPKGFITLADLRGTSLQRPFTDVHDVLALRSATPSSDCRAAVSRQAPLVQHVFWMLDRDHDGRVRFDDVRPHLTAGCSPAAGAALPP